MRAADRGAVGAVRNLSCGIVLAGGRGARMGAALPKALVEIDGVTLLDRAIATLHECCDEVIVVAPAAVELGSIDARRVFDGAAKEGPLAGLVAGLEACDGETAAILGVDFPLVRAALLRDLAAGLAAEPACEAVVTRPGGIAQPLVSAMRVRATATLRAAFDEGVRSMHGGIERLNVCWLDDEWLAQRAGGAGALLNVNTPEDLAAARLLLAQRAPAQSPRSQPPPASRREAIA